MRGLLIYIAKNCGLFGSLETSTVKLAKELEISQQTVSRKLRDLEKHGMIKREVSPQGLKIMLDEKGKEYLRKKYNELRKVFGFSNKLNLKLVSGLGEGQHYTDIYKKRIKEIFSFDVYSGTLNLEGSRDEIMSFISDLKSTKIDGFKKGNRTYGAINCYKILVNNIESVAVIPERTIHDKNILELICEFNLRDRLNLKDGDKVEICQR